MTTEKDNEKQTVRTSLYLARRAEAFIAALKFFANDGPNNSDDPTQNAYVFLRALTADLLRAGLLRPELEDIDLAAQTAWAIVHGAAALELTLANTGPWLDFRPRSERFAAALEAVARSLSRDPDDAVRRLRQVLAEDSGKAWGLGLALAATKKEA